ncbi:sensor domain-containing protein [Streptomyces roseoverticillatus]|uniref:sensor histidine kinase n=1 Tax=Streptomyces roseoverticillatus TaxID=66429 RepID=UPI0034004955
MKEAGSRGDRGDRGFSLKQGPAAGLRALRRSLVLSGLSVAESLAGLLFGLAVSALGTGLGPALLPGAARNVRRLAGRQRELARQWSGVDVPEPYEPAAAPAATSAADRGRALLKDARTWREWRWATVDPVVGGALAFAPIALVLSGLWGVFLGFEGGRLAHEWGGVRFGFLPVDGPVTAAIAGVLGVCELGLALWVAPRTVRAHARWTRRILAPGEAERMARMTHRIEHLSTTRSHAADARMAEIRRIERDLHDGAQARLVAMGMTLDAAEHLLEKNPEAVRGLLAEARKSSAAALEELRDLVRGIHPPVLADRGLPDAVRALAMVSPLTTEVAFEVPGRPEPPVESALYFAVSEALTNAAKHSGAGRAWIDARYEDAAGTLRLTVTDDGHGGADVTRGTGLRGIERRLATFDGVLAVSSPVGGPTIVTMEVPCALSSPRTTSC